MGRHRLFHPVLIAALCLASRLTFFVLVRSWDEGVAPRLIASDYIGYHRLALGVIENHRFACDPAGPPEALRTPGYPAFVAVGYALFGQKLSLIILGQILLDTMTALLLFFTITGVLGPSIGFGSALIYAIDPFVVLFANSLGSETLFIFSLAGGFYLLTRGCRLEPDRHPALKLGAAAVAFGLAALTRPIAFYLAPLVTVVILIRYRGQAWRAAKLALLFVLFFLVTVVPWMIRNYSTFKSFSLSTSSSYNFLFLYALEGEMERLHQGPESVSESLTREVDRLIVRTGEDPGRLNEFEKARYWQQLAWRKLTASPGITVKHYFLGIFRFFFSVETEYYAHLLNLPRSAVQFTPRVYPGVVSMVQAWFARKPKAQIVLGLGLGLYLIATYSLGLAGLFTGWTPERSWFLGTALLVTLYFIGITGTVGDSRLRMPAVPFYLCFIGIALSRILNRRDRRGCTAA